MQIENIIEQKVDNIIILSGQSRISVGISVFLYQIVDFFIVLLLHR